MRFPTALALAFALTFTAGAQTAPVPKKIPTQGISLTDADRAESNGISFGSNALCSKRPTARAASV